MANQIRSIAKRAIEDELVLVTNNGPDFVRVVRRIELHPGLIVLVPNGAAALQRILFTAALEYSAGRDLTNTVVEVDRSGEIVRCSAYELPSK